MPAENSPSLSCFPEELISSRDVGHLAAGSLPWIEDPARRVAVSELVFPEGTMYAASAGTKQLNKITANIQSQDRKTDEHGYTRLDRFFLRACRLEAGGKAIDSANIQPVHTQRSRSRSAKTVFDDYSVKYYREAMTPNSRRIFYVAQSLARTALRNTADAPRDGPLLIRIAITDKQHQLECLHQITGWSRKELQVFGAGN